MAYNGWGRIALVGETAADVRDVMILGESGIMSLFKKSDRPKYIPSKRLLRFQNGSICTTYSGKEPDQLRGPQHHGAWADELAKWQYATETWANLMMGLRLGKDPRAIISTTPRPIAIIRKLIEDQHCVVTKASTYDNQINLPDSFVQEILSEYEGTRLGRQELYADVLDDVPGALWSRKLIENNRVKKCPELVRIVVSIDPAVTSKEGSDETGLIVAGACADGHGYTLEDLSGRHTPDEWARRAIDAYYRWGADRIIGEVNNGGDLIETVLRTKDPNVSYKGVRASKGKYTRAEPVAALAEQGKDHHVGMFEELEDQLCTYVPGESSPDRLDAKVWAYTELLLKKKSRGRAAVC